jgi:hypothetical protein
MADNTRYHRLPEDNRPSLDFIPGDDERLLDPADDGDDQNPPKKDNELSFSFHPTLILRLVNVIFLTISLAFYIICRQRIAIAAIVFTCIALLRNLLVLLGLFQRLITRRIRFHIEIVGSSRSTKPAKAPAWLKSGGLQVALDLLVALTLLITVTVAIKADDSYRWGWNRKAELLVPACVLGWIVMLVSFRRGVEVHPLMISDLFRLLRLSIWEILPSSLLKEAFLS